MSPNLYPPDPRFKPDGDNDMRVLPTARLPFWLEVPLILAGALLTLGVTGFVTALVVLRAPEWALPAGLVFFLVGVVLMMQSGRSLAANRFPGFTRVSLAVLAILICTLTASSLLSFFASTLGLDEYGAAFVAILPILAIGALFQRYLRARRKRLQLIASEFEVEVAASKREADENGSDGSELD